MARTVDYDSPPVTLPFGPSAIADDAVTTAKILDAAVTLAKLAQYPQTFCGLSQGISSGATRYVPPNIQDPTMAPALTAGPVSIVAPVAGSLSAIYAFVDSAMPSSQSYVVTLQINTVDTAIEVTIPAGTGAGVVVSTTGQTVTFEAGDILVVKFVRIGNSGVGNLHWGIA